MDKKYMDVGSTQFDGIVADIKYRNLSNSNMPKLSVGTGLSNSNGIPGMGELSKHLDETFNQSANNSLMGTWNKYSDNIKK